MSLKSAMINRPDIFEVMELPPGVKKVSCQMDSRVSNCGTFLIYLEDHTIGNMLRMQLLRDDNVLFAAYRVPHPLEHNLEIRIQTNESSTPFTALYSALTALITQFSSLTRSFKKQVQDARYRPGFSRR